MSATISQCSLDVLQKAAENLKSGGLIVFPTETVYGIGADAENVDAISRMYAVKNRPADHPVIVHIAELDDVDYWAIDGLFLRADGLGVFGFVYSPFSQF